MQLRKLKTLSVPQQAPRRCARSLEGERSSVERPCIGARSSRTRHVERRQTGASAHSFRSLVVSSRTTAVKCRRAGASGVSVMRDGGGRRRYMLFALCLLGLGPGFRVCFRAVRRGDVRAAGFPLLPAPPRSAGSWRWESGHDSVSVSVPLQPPPPLYSAGATGAHNPVGLGSPD